MNCKTLFLTTAVAIGMLITGCSKAITIEITTPPPASLEVNDSATIAATVMHNSEGVDWSCTPTGSCGTFTPSHTVSGASTVYMAPRTSGPVTITAASTGNPEKVAHASVTINPVATAADITGTYTFFVNGTDSSDGGDPISVAGSVVLGGAKITGEQDYFDIGTGDIFPKDPIVSGSITVGNDGRGTLSLTPTSAPAETFSITVVNNKHILITQFNANATAHGSLDLQTAPTSVPMGGNAFALFDLADAYAVGGVLTSSGTAITASQADDDVAGTATFDFAIGCTSPCITAPDPAGRGTVTLTDPNSGFGAVKLAYYVVGPEAFRLIEFDGTAFAAGSMYGQGAGGFSASTLGKSFVFGQSGAENVALGWYAAAGQFTGNGTSALSGGVADVNLGDGKPVKAGALSGSAYFVKANGYAGITLSGANTDGLANFGVYLVDPAINVADPNNTSGGGGAVMLDLDANNIGVGIVVPQATGATFSGNYAFSQDGVFQTSTPTFAWYGLVGQIVSYDTSAVEGLADYNELNIAQTPAVTVTGTFTADMNNAGRSTAQITINSAKTPNNLTIYQASSALLLHVDVDSPASGFGTIGLGVLEQQQ